MRNKVLVVFAVTALVATVGFSSLTMSKGSINNSTLREIKSPESRLAMAMTADALGTDDIWSYTPEYATRLSPFVQEIELNDGAPFRIPYANEERIAQILLSQGMVRRLVDRAMKARNLVAPYWAWQMQMVREGKLPQYGSENDLLNSALDLALEVDPDSETARVLKAVLTVHAEGLAALALESGVYPEFLVLEGPLYDTHEYIRHFLEGEIKRIFAQKSLLTRLKVIFEAVNDYVYLSGRFNAVGDRDKYGIGLIQRDDTVNIELFLIDATGSAHKVTTTENLALADLTERMLNIRSSALSAASALEAITEPAMTESYINALVASQVKDTVELLELAERARPHMFEEDPNIAIAYRIDKLSPPQRKIIRAYVKRIRKHMPSARRLKLIATDNPADPLISISVSTPNFDRVSTVTLPPGSKLEGSLLMLEPILDRTLAAALFLPEHLTATQIAVDYAPAIRFIQKKHLEIFGKGHPLILTEKTPAGITNALRHLVLEDLPPATPFMIEYYNETAQQALGNV